LKSKSMPGKSSRTFGCNPTQMALCGVEAGAPSITVNFAPPTLPR